MPSIALANNGRVTAEFGRQAEEVKEELEVDANLREEHWQVTNNLRKTLEMPVVT